MATDLAAELNFRRFTADEYYEMGRTGILPEHEKTELIDGHIVAKMSEGPQHTGGVALANHALARMMSTHYIMPNGSVRLTDWSAPAPDFALIAKTRWRPGQLLIPGDLYLEVSDSSLRYDRRHKTSLYAQAGVPEYWVVNLKDRCVEVYRDPVAKEDTLYGGEYEVHTVHASGEMVSPQCRPDVQIAVADLLPEPFVSEQP